MSLCGFFLSDLGSLLSCPCLPLPPAALRASLSLLLACAALRASLWLVLPCMPSSVLRYLACFPLACVPSLPPAGLCAWLRLLLACVPPSASLVPLPLLEVSVSSA